jgi:glycosyltransferase involved in cell wall biosynthesis
VPAGGPRVAIVHERFTEVGGSERVVATLARMWPQATLFAAIADRRVTEQIVGQREVRTSPLQSLYRGGPRYSHLVPLLPAAMAALDVAEFDLVVTSHHAFANRVRPRPDAITVSYVHTPARWLWETDMRRLETANPLGRLGLATFAAGQRRADRRAAQRMTALAANSAHVARRIRRWWGAPAQVIHPPVNVDFFTPAPVARQPFFLLAGRLVPYKRPEVAVEAATRAGVRLVVAGDGRAHAACRAAAGAGVEFAGMVDDATLRDLMRRCRALIFPGEEDFGMVPVEAQACGAPVIARGTGGASETVVDGVTGVLYPAGGDEVARLSDILSTFTPGPFSAASIRVHAERFSATRFENELATFVEATAGVTSTNTPLEAGRP